MSEEGSIWTNEQLRSVLLVGLDATVYPVKVHFVHPKTLSVVRAEDVPELSEAQRKVLMYMVSCVLYKGSGRPLEHDELCAYPTRRRLTRAAVAFYLSKLDEPAGLTLSDFQHDVGVCLTDGTMDALDDGSGRSGGVARADKPPAGRFARKRKRGEDDKKGQKKKKKRKVRRKSKLEELLAPLFSSDEEFEESSDEEFDDEDVELALEMEMELDSDLDDGEDEDELAAVEADEELEDIELDLQLDSDLDWSDDEDLGDEAEAELDVGLELGADLDLDLDLDLGLDDEVRRQKKPKKGRKGRRKKRRA